MMNRVRLFVLDPKEIERYARAIAHIADKHHAADSPGLVRDVNTYGTAFQFLVMRRGATYGRALGIVASNEALALVERPREAEVLVAGDIAAMHERVCVAEEEAQARERES